MSLDTDQETYGQKDVKYLVGGWGREKNKNRNREEVFYRFNLEHFNKKVEFEMLEMKIGKGKN